MNKYRKKPLIIEAMQYTGDNKLDIIIKMKIVCYAENMLSDDLIIETLEGDMRARPGDYIVKGTHGEFYPVKREIFESNNEREDDETI
jgi:NAD-dependent SIR2 family protein deacetylase